MKIIKILGLTISFASISIFLIFLMQTMVKELDSPILLFIGVILLHMFELMNGIFHSKLIQRIENNE